MRITRLRLKDVKRHADLELELAPGLTIVRGPNEAGKTTIQQALELALFRRATTEARELEDLRRWGADRPPTVIVDFADEGIRGRLAKTFAGGKGTAELTTEQGVERDPAAIEHVISSLTGLPNERFFKATASVHHHDLADLKQDEGTLRDRLQQSMSGATRGTHAAKRKLDEAIRRYRSEGPKNPGYLKVARAEVERLESEVARGEAELRQLESDRRGLAEARDRRTATDVELAHAQQEHRTAERAVALEERAAAAQQRYTTFKRATELLTEIGRLEGSHPSAISLPGLRAAVDRLRNLEYRLSEIRAELAAEPDISFEAVPEPPWRQWAAAAGGLAVVAVLLLVGGLLLDQLLLGAGAALLLGSAALFVGLRSRRLRTHVLDVQQQNELRENEINRRLRGRSERADELRETEREREQALATLGMDDLAQADQLLLAETDHVSSIEQLRAEYRGLMGEDQPEQDVAELRDQAAAEADQCRHTLAGMGEIGAEPQKSLAASRTAVERLRAEREQRLAIELQAEARLDANGVDAEQVAANVEALGEATEQLRQIERRLRVYELTLGALQAAEAATMQKAARFLEQAMGRDIERITGGRYRRLRVDEAKLEFSVYSEESREWVDAGQLSRGTVDQLYLCARLGIVRQITQPASPPLVFDDPFVTFDEARARRAVELLRDVAGELQVIYLTCSDRYDGLAERVIVLDDPAEAGDSASVEAVAPSAGAEQPARVKAPAA
jgi:DNA repair exonuclease SbcCD ATPase subunit